MTCTYPNLGAFLDKCSDNTVVDIDFTTEGGVQRVPSALGFRPTVADVKANAYLRARPISAMNRFTDLLLPHLTGWSISVPEPFDEDAYMSSSAD